MWSGNRARVGWLLAALFCMPGGAEAHLVSTRFGELYSGLLHPLTAPIHLVPWLGLGLLGGFQERETARWVLLVFPLTVLIGTALGGRFAEQELVTHANLLSIVVLGGLVALASKPWGPLFLLLTALVGLSHGYANGAPELRGNQQILYVLGVTIVAYVVITLVTAASLLMARHAHWSRIAVRAAGSWIAAIGILFGGFVLVGAAAQ